VSEDELRESSVTRGGRSQKRQRRAIDSQTQSIPPSRSPTGANLQASRASSDLPVATRSYPAKWPIIGSSPIAVVLETPGYARLAKRASSHPGLQHGAPQLKLLHDASQFSKRKPGTFSKSRVFAVRSSALFTNAIDAIFRSELPTFRKLLRRTSNCLAASSSKSANFHRPKNR